MMECVLAPRNMEMKGSRRKQSKPSRMARDLEEAGMLPYPTHVDSEKMDMDSNENETEATPMEVHGGDNVGCPYCGIQLPSIDEMKEHVKSKHPPPPLEKLPEETSVFPTAYHRLASELTDGANMGSSEVSETVDKEAQDNQEKPSNEKSLETKNSSASDQADEKIPIGPEGIVKNGSRIFHQDAYCDLCDREFCNKYFLKTHRANKHNIYDSPPTFPPPTMGFPEFPANPIDLASAILGKELLKEKTQEESLHSKPVNTDLEDFCEICQKHFCNKYYLRKHKADVHGIKPENQSSSRSWNNSSIDNQSSVATSSGFSSSTMTAQSAMGAMPNLLYLNPFIPPMALLPARSLMQSPFAFLPNHSSALALPGPTSIPVMSPSVPGTHASTPSMPSSLASSSPMPSNALRSIGVLNADAYCDICRKEFCNKYFLKIHKANKHGITDESKSSSLPGSSPSSPPSSVSNALQSTSPSTPTSSATILKTPSIPSNVKLEPSTNGNTPPMMDGESSQFPQSIPLNLKTEPAPLNLSQDSNSMSQDSLPTNNLSMDASVAENLSRDAPVTSSSPTSLAVSRSSDRLACDICNKEVSSKYVLKIHKFKYHGIGAYSDIEMKTDEAKENKPTPETLSLLQNGPSDSELTTMGIDPEAYCKICKKEFCSKYFLRTHLFNMHGIRTEATDKRISTPSTTSTPKPVSVGPGGERHTWRWKEPANMTRVFCDICNKELCNKYFLRTHKLNKHGVYTEDEPSPRRSMNFSGPPTMVSTNSNLLNSMMLNSSSDNSLSEIMKKESELDAKEKIGDQKKAGDESSPMAQYLSQLSEVCQLCSRRFRNKQWLELHLRNDHGMNPESAPPSLPNEQEVNGPQGSFAKTCDFCGMLFHAEQDFYNHLMKEHTDKAGYLATQKMFADNFQMKRRYIKSMKQKMYSCSHCDYKTRWLSNVYSHEQRKHNTRGGQNLKIYTCQECLRTFSYEHSLIRHMTEYHRANGVSRETTTDMAQGGNAGQGKRFRCAHCGERFGSRVLCLTHIRIVHRKNLKEKKAGEDGKLSSEKTTDNGQGDKSKPVVHSCSQCNFSSKFYRNLRMHILLKHKVRRQTKPPARRPVFSTMQGDQPMSYAMPFKVKDDSPFIMQPFTLKEDLDGNFVTATVYLPVKERITETKQVSFSLTPAQLQ